jgi:hypothetical protein
MKTAPFLPFAAISILAGSLCFAQSPQPQRPADGGTREMLISILIPSLPNAPFTATVRTEWVRQFADGSTITLKNHRAIARDGAGRIFQERRMLVPDESQGDSPVTQIEISDPVSRQLYICKPHELVCQLEMFSRPERANLPAVPAAPKAPGSPDVEDLGTQFISGVETVGRRETAIIPSGVIGNDRPLMTKREFWYSPVLGVNVISKRQDPRFGTQNFEVTDIVLGEPDPKLFELPSGSKVIDLRKPPEVPSSQSPSSN